MNIDILGAIEICRHLVNNKLKSNQIEVDAIQTLIDYVEQQQSNEPQWISVNEQMPESEVRVLVCAEIRIGEKVYKHITTAMYEDGTVWRENSSWNFNDIDNFGTYDEEQDDYKIPEGWWEYTIYNGDEGNYLIDDFVTHWMPLPQPLKGE